MLARAILTTLLLAAADAAPPPGDGPAAAPAAPEVAKLRKLHLVRPDLIPYPLAYDVYC